MPLAEENFFRGYEQALTDIQTADQNDAKDQE